MVTESTRLEFSLSQVGLCHPESKAQYSENLAVGTPTPPEIRVEARGRWRVPGVQRLCFSCACPHLLLMVWLFCALFH